MSDWRNRITGLEYHLPSEIADHPQQWRTHPGEQAAALKAVLNEVGIAGALLAYRRDGELVAIDGHLRKSLDPAVAWPVLVLDVDEQEAAKLLAAHDPIAAMAGADAEALAELLAQIETEDEALQAMLKELAEEYGILGDEPPDDPGAQIDKAAELQEKWGTCLGQCWVIPSRTGDGEHRLVCGDCTDPAVVAAVMQGERAGAGVTDPPYNVKVLAVNDDMPEMDFVEWCASWVMFLPETKVLTVGIKNLLLWDNILGPPQWIIAWVKKNGGSRTGLGGSNGKWDPILLYGVDRDNDIDIVEFSNDYRGTLESGGLHLTAKPLDLWIYLIRRFGGQVIYDPFLGSGTTLVACEQLGRLGRGIELDPGYCAVALQRLQGMGLEPRLAGTVGG